MVPSASAEEVLARYLVVSKESALRGVSMEVDFEARIPKLRREGRLHALRIVTKVGQIRYIVDRFVGDNGVKKDVIARFISAETENNRPSDDISISHDNYKFKHRGHLDYSGRVTHVYQVSPRKKRVGLFKGELWVDAETGLAVREAGRWVKSPSVFLKKVEFVRDYKIQDGKAFPVHTASVVDTRFWGPAELNIRYGNFSCDDSVDHAAILTTSDAN